MRVSTRGEDAGDDALDVRLGRSGKIPRGIELADRIAERTVDGADGALVAGALLRRAVQRLAIEVEMRVVERAWQDGSDRIDTVERQPVLPRLQRLAGDECCLTRDRRGLPRDEVALGGQAGRLPEGAPIKPWCAPREVGLGPGIVALAHLGRW